MTPVRMSPLPRVPAHPCPLTDGPCDKHGCCPLSHHSRSPQLCALAGNTPGLLYSKEAQRGSGLGRGLQRLHTGKLRPERRLLVSFQRAGPRSLFSGLVFLLLYTGWLPPINSPDLESHPRVPQAFCCLPSPSDRGAGRSLQLGLPCPHLLSSPPSRAPITLSSGKLIAIMHDVY